MQCSATPGTGPALSHPRHHHLSRYFLRLEVAAQLRISFNAWHVIDALGEKYLRKEFSGGEMLRKEWLVFSLKWKTEQ